jgi:hypothetical protein
MMMLFVARQQRLLKHPALSDCIGGIQGVTLGEAQRCSVIGEGSVQLVCACAACVCACAVCVCACAALVAAAHSCELQHLVKNPALS